MPIHPDSKEWPAGTRLACKTKCQFRGRAWKEGEILTAQEGEIVCHHFIPRDSAPVPESVQPETGIGKPKEFQCPDCGDLVPISGKGAHARWCKGRK